jgi:predicted membrane protein
MSWFFLAPLAIALAVTYIFKNSANEAAYLAISIAAVCLTVSLFLAPWQIKALLLIMVILASRKLLASILPVDDEENKNIQLLYRGINYEVIPSPKEKTFEASELKITGKYRGQVWQNHKPNNTVTVTAGIKYRGVPINSSQSIAYVKQTDKNIE